MRSPCCVYALAVYNCTFAILFTVIFATVANDWLDLNCLQLGGGKRSQIGGVVLKREMSC